MKQNKLQTINVCFASDDGYAEHLLVAIFSLIANLKTDYKADIYILDGGISEKNRNNLKNLERKFANVQISFIAMSDEKYDHLPTCFALTKATYFRLELANLLPNIHKMLYLDVDIIVNKDISELWEIDIGDNALGAITDAAIYYYNKLLHIPSKYGYFNAGVLLMNFPYFREHTITSKIFDWIDIHNKIIILGDQDALNAILRDQRKELPLKYNVLPYIFTRPRNQLFSQKERKKAKTDPVIIHFAGTKPWKKYCFHPLRHKYHAYRGMAGVEPITFSKKIDIGLFMRNCISQICYHLFNIIPQKWHYALLYKPKEILGL
ncbi:general stress protein A [candidate division SR1 bacterium]|nr:general stress protein A [candidate division SR1 bacterium]